MECGRCSKPRAFPRKEVQWSRAFLGGKGEDHCLSRDGLSLAKFLDQDPATELSGKLRNSENPFKKFFFLVCNRQWGQILHPNSGKVNKCTRLTVDLDYQLYGVQNGEQITVRVSTAVKHSGKTHRKGWHTLPGLGF